MLIKYGTDPTPLEGTTAYDNYIRVRRSIREEDIGKLPAKNHFIRLFVEEYMYGYKDKAIEYVKDIDINYKNGILITMVAENGDVDILKLLLIKKGVNVDFNDGYLLMFAVENNDIDILKLILEKKPRKGLLSALSVAAACGYDDCVEVLINYLNPSEDTKAYDNYIRVRRNIKTKKEESKKNINERFKEEYMYGDDDKAKEYVRDIDVDYEHGHFLILAAEGGDIDMLKLLLAKKPTEGLSGALGIVSAYGYDDCIELLIKHGVEGNTLYDNYMRVKKGLV